jgi:endonuclease YncB( thermonuclease family)
MSDRIKQQLSTTKALFLCALCCVITYGITSRAYRSKQPTSSQPTASVSTTTAVEPQTISAQPTPPVFYTVAEVLEPNILKLKDGPTVSLIGVSCPIDLHTDDSVTPMREAVAFTQGLLEGRRVRLEYETHLKTDSENRTLAYVYLENGPFLNAELIKRGYGSTTEYTFRFRRDFQSYEEIAENRGLGVWDVTGNSEPETTVAGEIGGSTDSNPVTASDPIAPPSRPRTVSTDVLPAPRTLGEDNSIASGVPQVTVPSYVPPQVEYKPPVAENGSYYGQISEATGRPKTVHVEGYYRRDGTYVRGHYRSRPRRR